MIRVEKGSTRTSGLGINKQNLFVEKNQDYSNIHQWQNQRNLNCTDWIKNKIIRSQQKFFLIATVRLRSD